MMRYAFVLSKLKLILLSNLDQMCLTVRSFGKSENSNPQPLFNIFKSFKNSCVGCGEFCCYLSSHLIWNYGIILQVNVDIGPGYERNKSYFLCRCPGLYYFSFHTLSPLQGRARYVSPHSKREEQTSWIKTNI